MQNCKPDVLDTPVLRNGTITKVLASRGRGGREGEREVLWQSR